MGSQEWIVSAVEGKLALRDANGRLLLIVGWIEPERRDEIIVAVARGETMITGSDTQRVLTLEKNLERATENVERLNGKVAGLQAMARTLEKHGPLAERWRMVVDLWRGMKSPGEFVEYVEDYATEHNVPLADAVRAIHKAWERCGRPSSGTEDRQMKIDG